MKIFAQRLKERAKMLGLADAEVARRAGLSERRYGNYVSGIREPDLYILTKIATALSTTPNHLLGFEAHDRPLSGKDRMIERLINSANALPCEDLETILIQIEALTRHRRRSRPTPKPAAG
jgi:transcriptional regulator with XRE-family HTH domain